MRRFARLWNSSIGLKWVMALTGIGLLLFVIGHMLGNLQLFLGQEQLNAYALKLQSLGPLLWMVRIGLGAVFLVHVGAAIRITRLNRAARPVPYAHPQATVVTTYAARTMFWSGLVVAAFLVYHLLHFTIGTILPEAYALEDASGRHDVYSMVVIGFSHLGVALSYIVAQIVLGVHISHGASSLFQTLGARNPGVRGFSDRVGPVLAAIIVVGNISMPLAVLAGFVSLPEGVA